MFKSKYIISGFILLLFNFSIHGQCAMCKAAVESSEDTSGFNDAILFLMLIPYFIGFIALIIFIYNSNSKTKLKL